jgi:hypothetical protein
MSHNMCYDYIRGGVNMKLNVGETYNFFKNIEDWWIVKVLERCDEQYYVEVLKHVCSDKKRLRWNEGEKGFIGFRSTMFTTYQITKYHKADIDESFDPEIEELIAHIQKRFTLDKLTEAIDKALAEDNKELFIQLTNQLKGVHV